MIDHDDADQMWLVAMFTNGPFGILALLFFIFIAYKACKNDEDCQKRTCPEGARPVLEHNMCACIQEAK